MRPVQGLRRARIPCMIAVAALFVTPAAGEEPAAESHASLPAAAAPDDVLAYAREPSHADAIAAVTAEIARNAKGNIGRFYKSRANAPLWAATGSIPGEAEGFVATLDSAGLDGLKPRRYRAGKLRGLIASARGGSPRAVARAELALSQAFARYVGDLRSRPGAAMTYADDSLRLHRLSEQEVLAAAALARPFPAYVATMGWMSPHYREIRTLLAQARRGGAPKADLERLRLNLERARLLPGPWVHHVVVDASSGRLWWYQAGREAGSMRVVVGKPATPTPLLAGKLRYAVLNPYWNVPVDLARTSIAPKVLGGRSLRAMGMEALADWTAQAVRLDPARIDWNAVASGTREIRIRQLPGKANSMGMVKFMFPNEMGIYLHDTPERDLLTEPDRHFSNGCIRLEDAGGLGRWLLGRAVQTRSRAPEQIVPLPWPVPVYLTYLTAGEGDGRLAFRPDVYGLDGGGDPSRLAAVR
jgi:L,D-transpeptidase YcbB